MTEILHPKSYTCIVCPKGCEITAHPDTQGNLLVSGASCSKGEDYVRKELLDPRRILTTSVLVCDGDEPLVSVRTTEAIPRRLLLEGAQVLSRLRLRAPVALGQVIVADFLGTGSDVVATRSVSIH